MKVVKRIYRAFNRAVAKLGGPAAKLRWKETSELNYWQDRQRKEGVLSNRHYKHFYTAHFGLDDEFYNDKTIVDIGCGPRGSLEWASMARRRIGVDPLAEEYLRLGANQHQMEYASAPAERIPLSDAECDVVFSFNSLDHVENVEAAIDEIKRITRPGGLFLLLVEVNHPPTDCEPHELTPERIVKTLEPEFRCEGLKVYRPRGKGMYDSIHVDDRISDPLATREVGYLSATFVRS
jgi:SAM-dependent methyltransferase